MRMSDWSSDVCSSDLVMLVFSVSPILAPLAGSVIIALAAYRTLLTDPAFLGLSFIGAFGISSFFAYLANSSFVLIEHYGLTPTLYSIAFSINAVSRSEEHTSELQSLMRISYAVFCLKKKKKKKKYLKSTSIIHRS